MNIDPKNTISLSTEEQEEEEEQVETEEDQEPATLKDPPRQEHYYEGPVGVGLT